MDIELWLMQQLNFRQLLELFFKCILCAALFFASTPSTMNHFQWQNLFLDKHLANSEIK